MRNFKHTCAFYIKRKYCYWYLKIWDVLKLSLNFVFTVLWFWENGFITLNANLRTSSFMNGSVRLSVCPSVCPSVRPSFTPFSLCTHHCLIVKFSGVINNNRSDLAKGQCQVSKVKATEVKTQFSHFRTVTSTSNSKGFIRHKYTKAKQKHAYYIVMSGDSY